MKGDEKVIDYLNQVLKNELTAINQYFLHARIFKSWGLNVLNQHEYQESVDEMKHADLLVERILFLGGLPNMQDIGALRIGENPAEILAADLKLEQAAIPVLREAVPYCEAQRDFVSRDLFATILASEEGHIDWLETQLQLIDRIGIENYLQSKT